MRKILCYGGSGAHKYSINKYGFVLRGSDAKCSSSKNFVGRYIQNYHNANHGHPPPSEQSFVRAVQNLRDRGRFSAFVGDRGRAQGREFVALEEQILDEVEANPRISTRRLTAQLGQMSNFVTWRTIHENSLYPYHLQKVQALQDGDYALRLEFCHWYIQKNQEDADWSHSVLYTDEATFTRDGIWAATQELNCK